MNVREMLAAGRARLRHLREGALEAEVLAAHLLGESRAWLYANPDTALENGQAARYAELVERRAAGEPVAYLTGQREFWSLTLKITPDVLIPRPETELLVETVLDSVPPDAAWRIADLGTGSGAIALALASERPYCEIHATDVSTAALSVARQNADRLAPGRIRFHHGSWLEPLEGRFHLLVSNPPYVASGDSHLRLGDCRYEPEQALTPGEDALAAIRNIAGESLHYLEPGGMLAFEHGYDQGEASARILEELGYRQIVTRKDLEQQNRVSCGVYAPASPGAG